jgi:hypothetical protein
MRLFSGAALAYWLAGIVNPAFIAIGVMIVFFVPVFYSDYVHAYSRADSDSLLDQPAYQPIKKPVIKKLIVDKPSSTQLLKEAHEKPNKDKDKAKGHK